MKKLRIALLGLLCALVLSAPVHADVINPSPLDLDSEEWVIAALCIAAGVIAAGLVLWLVLRKKR